MIADGKQNGSTNPVSPSVSAYGNLPNEQIRNEPSPQGGGFEKMARRRYQKPTPKKRGNQWTILVREDVVKNGQRERPVKRVPLGPSSLTKAEAERARDDYLADINQTQVGIGGAILFPDFARIYGRDVLPTMSSTTANRSRSVLKVHLIPEFRKSMLREMTVEVLQAYFTRLDETKDQSAESLDKIRDVLSSVLGTAVDYGRFRVSELAGLLWRSVHVDSITIERRISRGDEDVLKSEASQATIAVDDHVLERIQRLKTLEVVVRAGRATQRYKAVKSAGPDDLVFQSVKKGVPIRDNNVLVRHIKPAGRKLGIGWVNWQVLRRPCPPGWTWRT